MGFIVIEGLDGAGKSTQIKLLRDYLKKKNIDTEFVHFPRTDSGIFGDLVAKFLRGEFGELDKVNPYLVALIYAGDRNDFKTKLNGWLSEKKFVIVDRYVYSNIAFQCAKYFDNNKIDELKKWILNLEYNYYKIPKPDYSFFLDVPFEFTKKKLTENRQGNDRGYLKGKIDIHEQNLDFQERVRRIYLSAANENDNFQIINCRNNNNEMLKPDEISQKLINKIKQIFSI